MENKNTELPEIKIVELSQLPILNNKIKEAGLMIDSMLESLELEKQVITDDNLQLFKKTRASLNKEFASYKEQFKAVYDIYEAPMQEVKSLFKECITDKMANADNLLKNGIALVENGMKSEKEKKIKLYYDELCIAKKIDFIPFEKLGLDINLSTSEKKYKEQVSEYIVKVIDDLNLIKSTDYEAEILTEYKTTLNASKAITTVIERKKKEEEEKARILAQRTAQRTALCKYNGMVFVDITNAYEYSADVYVTTTQIETLGDAEFTALIAKVEQAIKDDKAQLLAKQQAEQAQQEHQQTENQVAQQPIQKAPVAPLASPTVEVKEEIVSASFTVSGTMTQLRSLGAYMKQNGIIYKNI